MTGRTGESGEGVFSPDPEAQIRQVFPNIALTLDEAEMVQRRGNEFVPRRSSGTEALLRVAAEFIVDPYPAWTAVGVTELVLPEAVVEISCVAMILEHDT